MRSNLQFRKRYDLLNTKSTIHSNVEFTHNIVGPRALDANAWEKWKSLIFKSILGKNIKRKVDDSTTIQTTRFLILILF